MEITFENYIKNPTGGRTGMVGQRDAAAAVYNEKFNNIIMKAAGSITYYLYKERDESRYVFYLKMPSETIDDLFYDVVIDFYTKDDVEKKSLTLDNYNVRFFSNDPNFNYTYAYTFKKNGLIIPELTNKLDPIAVKQKPKVTNPHTLVGYAKSIYSAYLFYSLKGLRQKALWYNAPPFKNGSPLQRLVMQTQNKLIQTERLRKIQAATKKGSMHIADVDDLKDLGVRVNRVENTKEAKAIAKKVYQGRVQRAKKTKKIKTVKVIGR